MRLSIPPKVYISAAIGIGVVTAVAHAAVTNGAIFNREIGAEASSGTNALRSAGSGGASRKAFASTDNGLTYFFTPPGRRDVAEPPSLDLRPLGYAPIPTGTDSVNYPTYDTPSFNDVVRGVEAGTAPFPMRAGPTDRGINTLALLGSGSSGGAFSEVVGGASRAPVPARVTTPPVDLTPPLNVTPVPEPGIWAMLLAGLGVITLAGASRSRQTRL
ncbi:PEP-CTERM sorting domain-containing protein [Noviherbaspirillum aridicola]|uniref:Ice-binding protein C-terminal domain-containing protein n=1 Tax=Noviherbaspirillum aridicola TaxID=2849687 RepID=A0ABQ4Q5M2_9BURK|nr:PEP-CTERM sorting domain-containing protein [Noviherbaspirillum aridicola]GIZ52500.1 hypothetical protein NCCP691_25140 [Noviherbaspirillum aridicola]